MMALNLWHRQQAPITPCLLPEQITEGRKQAAAMLAKVIEHDGYADPLKTANRWLFARWRFHTGRLSEVAP